MPEQNSEHICVSSFHTLVHIGCGSAQDVDRYTRIAEHVCLIDADPEVIESLAQTYAEAGNIHCYQALVDVEERTATFYTYNLPWANGIAPVDAAVQRLYPGLSCIRSTQQVTTSVCALLTQCLTRTGADADDSHMLILNLGQQNQDIFQALEQSGQLDNVACVVVLPQRHHAQPISVPLTLQKADDAPDGLTLPPEAQVLVPHPIVKELNQSRAQVQDWQQQCRLLEKTLRERSQERDQKAQQLEASVKELAELKQQLEASVQKREELQVKLNVKITAEEVARAEAAKCKKAHVGLVQEKDALKQQLDQRTKERDDEWHKGEELVAQRDDLQHKLEEALQQKEDALHQNHLNFEAKNAARAKVQDLEAQLGIANAKIKTLEHIGSLSAPPNESDTPWVQDGFYRALEDRFRGSCEEIKRRVAVYLPFVKPIADRNPDVSALDLGCGRGEWLEVLQEEGIRADGVDCDSGMLEVAREKNLNVYHDDILNFLCQQRDNSRICISLIHVVEHLPFNLLRTVVAEVKRVLVPDGILIMETPNPENLIVAACNFYMDPTHRNPLPPLLLAFVAEYGGFERVKVLRLQENLELEGVADFSAQDLIAGVSPDYSIVAQLSVPDEEGSFDSDVNSVWEREYGISFGAMTSQNANHETKAENQQ